MTAPLTPDEILELLGITGESDFVPEPVPLEEQPFGLTANGYAVPGGFTGTLAAALTWLDAHLRVGDVRITSPSAEAAPQERAYRVEIVTGGYSDDEALVYRVERSNLGEWFWESRHRGGRLVLTVPEKEYLSTEIATWVEEPSDVLQTVHHAAQVVLHAPNGTEQVLVTPEGAQLRFEDRAGHSQVDRPTGVLHVEPLTTDQSIWFLS